VTQLWTGRPEVDSRQGQGYFRHRFQTGCGTHTASYPMGSKEGSFAGVKATGACI